MRTTKVFLCCFENPHSLKVLFEVQGLASSPPLFSLVHRCSHVKREQTLKSWRPGEHPTPTGGSFDSLARVT